MEFFRVIKEKNANSNVLEINARELIPISRAIILVAADIKTVEVKDGAVLKIDEQYYIWNQEKKVLIAQI